MQEVVDFFHAGIPPRLFDSNLSKTSARLGVIGFVMGGGMGLMNGASHRVVTERSRLAMPEISLWPLSRCWRDLLPQ